MKTNELTTRLLLLARQSLLEDEGKDIPAFVTLPPRETEIGNEMITPASNSMHVSRYKLILSHTTSFTSRLA